MSEKVLKQQITCVCTGEERRGEEERKRLWDYNWKAEQVIEPVSAPSRTLCNCIPGLGLLLEIGRL